MFFFQGQTVTKPNSLVVDIQSAFKPGMVYVMLSRVCSLKQLFILETFNSDKITVCHKVKAEYERMMKIAVNNNPTNWNNTGLIGIRVSSLNVRSLRKHIEDVRSDNVLLQSDIICLHETWLEKGEEETGLFALDGYTGYFTSQGRGKGMAIYIKDEKKIDIQSITTPSLQMTKLSCSDTLDIIAIYRSQEESFVSVETHLQIMVDPEKNTLIVGDFNFCYLQKTNAIFKYLKAGGFKQLVVNPTHISGGMLYANFLCLHCIGFSLFIMINEILLF